MRWWWWAASKRAVGGGWASELAAPKSHSTPEWWQCLRFFGAPAAAAARWRQKSLALAPACGRARTTGAQLRESGAHRAHTRAQQVQSCVCASARLSSWPPSRSASTVHPTAIWRLGFARMLLLPMSRAIPTWLTFSFASIRR